MGADLLEQAEQAGGKLAVYRRDGFAFDTGPSLFTLPAVYRDLFLKTGSSFEESVELDACVPRLRSNSLDGDDAIARAVASVPPPGANPTSMRTGRSGHSAVESVQALARASDDSALTFSFICFRLRRMPASHLLSYGISTRSPFGLRLMAR